MLVGKSDGSVPVLKKVTYSSLLLFATSGNGAMANSLRQLANTFEESEKENRTRIIVGISIVTATVIAVAAFLIYRYCIARKQEIPVDQEAAPLLDNE